MRNKEAILIELDACVARLKAESDGSKSSLSDIEAFKTIRKQYQLENIKGAQYTYNFLMDTYLREMLPEECAETLGFTKIKSVHKAVAETQFKAATNAEKAKEEAVIQIGMDMDFFEEHLRNTGGCDQYTTTAQAFRQALERAYDAGMKAKPG